MSCTEITQAQRKKNIYKHTKSGRSKAMEFSHIMRNNRFDLTRKNVDCSVNYIYLVGGLKSNEFFGEFVSGGEKYDGDVWKVVPSLTTPRFYHDVEVYDGFLYAVGGYNTAAVIMNNVEKYDGTTWTTAPSMVKPRDNHAVATYNGMLYAIGGNHIINAESVERYDGVSWAYSIPLLSTYYPNKLIDHDIAVYNNFLYVVGGTYGFGALNTVTKFDGDSWSVGPQLLTQRANHAIAVFNGSLYASGGLTTSTSNTNSVERLNSNDEWEYIQHMNTNRHAHNLVVYKGLLYALGGFLVDSNTPLQSVEVFDGTTWKILDGKDIPIPMLYTKGAIYNK